MSSLTTKKAIAYSFKSLLKEKPFNKITINDIANNCDINRQTFYYHFQDIQDLTEWICIREVDKILNDKKDFKNWQDKFLSIFKIIEEEKIFVINIYHSVSIEILRRNLYRLVYPIIYDEIRSISPQLNEDDVKFITDFCKYAFVSIVLDWIEKQMKEDPKIIVQKISNLVVNAGTPLSL